MTSTQQNRPCERVKRQFPIFPQGYPQSIVGAEELNFRVRDGNGCTLFAIITGSPAHTGGSFNTVNHIMLARTCQYFFDEFCKTHNFMAKTSTALASLFQREYHLAKEITSWSGLQVKRIQCRDTKHQNAVDQTTFLSLSVST